MPRGEEQVASQEAAAEEAPAQDAPVEEEAAVDGAAAAPPPAEAAADGTPPVRAAEEEIAPEGAEADAERRVEHDLDELLAKARERDEYLALAQRTQADFENYRKRVGRESATAEARGIGKLARELLPALDSLAKAIESAGEGEADLVEGVRLVHAELEAALARVGVESYSPEGERFDPEVHEAMAQQPAEGVEPGTVVTVYQRGYRLNGAVLRPARVVVAQ